MNTTPTRIHHRSAMRPVDRTLALSSQRRASSAALIALMGAVFALLAVKASFGDDRDLFSLQQDQPYVFTLLDTSGSMHWVAGQADGVASMGEADSPESRLYQAKSALYEVIRGLEPGVRLGFAHFEQEDLEIERKHWTYANGGAAPPWAAELPFALPGQGIYFGREIGTDSSYVYGNCFGGWDPYEYTSRGIDYAGVEAMRFSPWLGPSGDNRTIAYVEEGGNRYRVRMEALPAGSELGDLSIPVRVRVWRANNDCLDVLLGDRVINFVPTYAQDFDGTPFIDAAGNPIVSSFLSWNRGSSIGADFVCNSTPQWAPNDNASTGYQNPNSQLKYDTYSDPLNRGGGGAFERGEMVPWDWIEHNAAGPGFEVGNRQEILRRLAPNIAVPGQFATDLDGNPIPDFRVARYFVDQRANGRIELQPQFSRYPPITNTGSTPLQGMLDAFGDWFEDWEPIAEDDNDGDPSYICRQKYVILLSDGEETCGGTPATAATRLRNLGIRTFVVAFGGSLSADKVQDIADAGGTGTEDHNGNGIMDCEEFDGDDDSDLCPGPIVAADRNELVAALSSIFGAIQTRPQAFASAATSPSRTEDGNSIFLTSFLPIPGHSVWSGSVSHFVQPLPTKLDDDGNVVPDPDIDCAGLDPVRGCRAWDAGEAMLQQAPSSITLSMPPVLSDFGLGGDENDRRVFYTRGDVGLASVPRVRDYFGPGADNTVVEDLVRGFDPSFPLSFTLGLLNSAYDDVLDALRRTYERRSAEDPRNPGETLEWILGDVFHSSPFLVSNPNRPEYQIFDLNGYQEFFRKHEFRRRVVGVGANDGIIHFLDAGVFDPDYDSGDLDRTESSFTLGTGKEIFGIVPRALMPEIMAAETAANRHEFRADGVLWVDDVFIDPSHSGTPNPDDREWRSVAFTGYREGGRGYVAIDITQPDPVQPKQDTFGSDVFVPQPDSDYVPNCINDDTGYSAAQCGPVPYGSVLWEIDNFSDPDLRDAWSTPRSGRVRIAGASGIEDRYVAIFGGGINPSNRLEGNYFYMVDIETGDILYKRDPGVPGGGIPSDPAIVDRTGNGYIDYIYVGTLDGKMYKIDLTTPATIDGATGMIDSGWEPFEIFDTGGRPIFFPPSVVRYQGGTSLVAFGTGNREDLWDPASETEEGRFYVLLDDFFTAPTGLSETSLYAIDPDTDGELPDGFDPLATDGGYYFTLDPAEKLLSRVFTLAGVTIFSTFSPVDEPTSVNGELICETTGFTNIYVIFTTSGDPVGSDDRSRTVEGIVTNPFSDLDIDHDSGDDDDDDGEIDGCDESVAEAIRETLPPECRFNNLTVPLKMVRADTGLECVVAFPICIREFNWGDNIR